MKFPVLCTLIVCLLGNELSAIPDVTIGDSTSPIPPKEYPHLLFPSWRDMEARPIRPYLGYTGNRGVGYDTGYTTGGVFFTLPRPPNSELFHSFVNVQGHVLNQGKCAYNIGAGIRYLVPAVDHIVGFNVYYDGRKIHQTPFQQAGIGIEYLGQNWDFRANGYLPVWHHRISKRAFSPFPIHRTDVKQALAGFDAEWGVVVKHRTYCSPWGIYFAVGPYYYDSKCRTKLWGGRGRVVCYFYDFLSLEFDGSYDRIYKERYQGRAFFTFPFNLSWYIRNANWDRYCFPTAWQGLWNKALEPPHRNDLIVIEELSCSRHLRCL